MRKRFVSIVAVALLFGSAPGPGAQGSRTATDPLVLQVRVALGRGQVAEARQLAENAPGSAAAKDLARAMVDIYQGRDDSARKLLEPLVKANALGDAAVEFGLLEIRHGRRDEGWKILDPIVSNRTFNGPDDYFRLARAARASREYMLSADAYERTSQIKRADIQSERGDLFLQRDRAGDALTDYKAALSIDPGWIPAQVGMARALTDVADVSPEEAKKVFEDVRKNYPDHPDVLLFAAETALDEEDREAARRALDGLAAARPGTVDEAALRAAIAYHEGGTAAAEPALAAVRAIDPRSALGYRRMAEQAERRYLFDEAVSFLRQAVKHDPDDARAHVDLGLQLLRIGDEKEARTVLERGFELDKSRRLNKNLLDLLDRLDKFEVVPSGEFVFKFRSDEAAVLRAYALPLADEAYRTFQTRYGFKPQGPILVEVFPKHDDFAVRTLGLPGLVGALGACFGRTIGMDSPSARDPGVFSWQATLWHEIAHVFTLQVSNYKVPRWLTEGISVYEEYKRRPAWGRELTLEFAYELSRNRTFGVKGLPAAFKRPESLALAYFEASLVVEHLVNLNGDAGLRTLLLAYRDGETDADAFTKAFGQSLDAVDASFKTFIDQRYGTLSKAMAEAPKAGNDLASLKARAAQAPDNYISQLTLGQALMKAGDRNAARTVLERAATLAPQATGDGSPHALLAQLAIEAGDTARARRELRLLLESNHENVMAARELVELSAGAKDANAIADRDFGMRLVADLDPLDKDVHGLLGRRLLEKGTKADIDAALTEFRVALALGPANLSEAHADLADTLLRLGRREEAKTQALAALQIAPGFARAQDLLLAAIGREQ